MRTLPPHDHARNQGAPLNRPEWYRFAWQPAAIIAALSLGFAIVVQHVFRMPGYATAGRLLELLPWALALNICFFILILFYAWRGNWRRRLRSVLCCGVLGSGLLFLLPRALRLLWTQQRLYALGLIYAVFLLSMAAVAVWYAIANAKLGSRRSLRIWIVLASMLIYAGTTGWMRVSSRTTGDEPDYLLLTHSLVHDHDFDLSNNYAHKDYLAYYHRQLPPETVPGLNGTAMLYHDVGLPIIMVPGYAWAGWTGAMLTVNIISCLLALGIFEPPWNWEPPRKRQPLSGACSRSPLP